MRNKVRRTSLRLIRDEDPDSLALRGGGQAVSRGDDLTCPNCERRFARRSHRKGFWEFLCGFLLIYPYRCQLCAHRFLATPKLSRQTPHREFERLHVHFPVSFRSAYLDQAIAGEGILVTLSIRGCSLTAQQPLGRGALLRLSIRYAEQEPPVVIDVAGVRSSTGKQVGIEFLTVHPDEETRLRHLLEHLLYGRFH